MQNIIVKILPTSYQEVYEDSRVKPHIKIIFVASAYVILVLFVVTIFCAYRGFYYSRLIEQSAVREVPPNVKDVLRAHTPTTVNGVLTSNVELYQRIFEEQSQLVARMVNKSPTYGIKKVMGGAGSFAPADMHVKMVLHRHVGAGQLDSMQRAINASPTIVFVFIEEADADSTSARDRAVDSLLNGGLEKMIGVQRVIDSGFNAQIKDRKE